MSSSAQSSSSSEMLFPETSNQCVGQEAGDQHTEDQHAVDEKAVWCEEIPEPTPPPVTAHVGDDPPNRTLSRWRVKAQEEAASPPVVSPPSPVAPPVRVHLAEEIETRITLVRERSLPFWLWNKTASAVEWMFGLASMVVGLAVLAALPVLQFLSLGYFLEVSGRIARTKKFTPGFVGVRKAARVGSVVLGTWLMVLLLRLIADIWYSSYLIDPDSVQTIGLRILQFVATVLMVLHILAAWYCGGRLRHFFWPLLAPFFLFVWGMRKLIAGEALEGVTRPLFGAISDRLLADMYRVPPLTSWFPPAILWAALRRFHMYREARDKVWDFVESLRLPYYFWLGVRGFAGAIAWLFLPVLLLILSTKFPQQQNGLGGLCVLIGGPLFAWVLLYLPFLQAHFAAEGRFVAMFEVGRVRRTFHRAPIAYWFALATTLLFAFPLYLLKVEATPRELTWLPALFFVLFMLPTRFFTGWAVARGRKREHASHWLLHIPTRFAQLPVVGIYVFFVFFTQYIGWYGSWGLFEQHAFLVPVPFLLQ